MLRWLIRIQDDVWRAACEQAHEQGWPTVDAYVENCLRGRLFGATHGDSDADELQRTRRRSHQ